MENVSSVLQMRGNKHLTFVDQIIVYQDKLYNQMEHVKIVHYVKDQIVIKYHAAQMNAALESNFKKMELVNPVLHSKNLHQIANNVAYPLVR